MSVINRMLRDIQQRKSAPDSARLLQKNYSEQYLGNVQPRSRAIRLVLILFFIATAAVLSWLWVSNRMDRQPVIANFTGESVSESTISGSATDSSPTSQQLGQSKLDDDRVDSSLAAASELDFPIRSLSSIPNAAQNLPEHTTESINRANPIDKPALTRQIVPDGKAGLYASKSPTKQNSTASIGMLPKSAAVDQKVQMLDNFVERAEVFYYQGNYLQAIFLLEQLLQENPQNDQARFLLADALLRSNRPAEVLALFNDPVYIGIAQAQILLARAYVSLEQPLQAAKVLDRDALAMQNNSDWLGLRAAVAQQLGDHQIASAFYERALRTDPTQQRWMVGNAVSLEALGQQARAAEYYRTALASGKLDNTLMQFASVRLRALSDQSP